MTILKNTSVYDQPNLKAKILYEESIYNEPFYKRVKRRNGVTWYEIITRNNSIGYIKKEDAFQWKKVKITDENAYFLTRETKESKIEELILRTGSYVHIKHPHERMNDNYLIITSRGIVGEMPPSVSFRDPEWVAFRTLFTVSCIIVTIFYIGAMLAGKRMVFGGLIVIAIIVTALLFTMLLYQFIRVCKSILYDIRIRL